MERGWPPKDHFPWWFFISTGHSWVALPLGIVAIILVVYGISLTHRAFVERRSLKNMLLNSYDFWLGQFFLGDAVFYAVLVVATSRNTSVDLLVTMLFLFIAFPAVMAFQLWYRSRWR